MSRIEIDRFVASKEKWIAEKLAQSCARLEQRQSFALNYGDLIVYRGNKYPIIAQEGRRIGFNGDHFFMPPNLSSEQVMDCCIQIYRMLAKHDLTSKTLFYAEQMHVSPAAIKVSGAKTRWGSCSAQKNLNFSWRLIMADDEVIDYVVIHELAHLREMNHSQQFWAIVQKMLPDYKQRRAQLKALQKRLSVESWWRQIQASTGCRLNPRNQDAV